MSKRESYEAKTEELLKSIVEAAGWKFTMWSM